ncbi:hypothetical protein BOX15_Mlig014623g3, partial [Macrostomum lignano]
RPGVSGLFSYRGLQLLEAESSSGLFSYRGLQLLEAESSSGTQSPSAEVAAVAAAMNCSEQVRLFRDRADFSLDNVSSGCLPSLNRYSPAARAAVGIALSVLTSGICLGNLLVIMSVGLVKKLQSSPSNFLIVSLASSDLLVGLLVLPTAIAYQLLGYFPFPDTACDFWTSCDVLLCTSSILNLCAISIDRYLVITKPFEYAVKRTPSRMAAMISCVWLLSACISIPPMLGAKEPFVPGNCGYSETFGYQIYATIGAFYIPLSVMLVLYGNIFKLARRMAKADEQQKLGGGLAEEPQAAATGEAEAEAGAAASVGSALKSLRRRNNNGRGRPAGRSNSDTKAIKTLGAIMGCFTFCWLPFFIMQISLAIWKKVTGSKFDIEKNVFDTFLWLGYVNSFMNPIIYAKFNRDFRMPFKHLLLCHCRSINERLRSQQYSEQYGLPSSGRGTSKRRLGAGPTGANAGAAAANSAAPGASGRAGRSVRRASDASLRRSRHQKAAENNNEQMV